MYSQTTLSLVSFSLSLCLLLHFRNTGSIFFVVFVLQCRVLFFLFLYIEGLVMATVWGVSATIV